jgi:Zn-dependent protease
MLTTFSLGRLFGIRVGVHSSWLLIYGLVTYSIASSIDGLGRPAATALAAVCALFLFLSVIAHEFAHALVALRFGVRTRGITLFVFGGVATLESEPPTPLAEAVIAIAGPLASVAIAALAFGARELCVSASWPSALAAALAALVFTYLAVANAVLALFNLLPAFPMDGGRVLRAVLWKVRRSRALATSIAALLGVGFGVAFGVVGIVMFATTRTWQYAWYVVLSVFLVHMTWTSFVRARRIARLEAAYAAARALAV